MFLHLMRLHSDAFLVPTYDIDLIWHAHQLCVAAYSKDGQAIMGQLIAHDDSVGTDRSEGSHLHTNWAKTCVLWKQEYGEIYQRAGILYRGKPKVNWDDLNAAAACTGCKTPENCSIPRLL